MIKTNLYKPFVCVFAFLFFCGILSAQNTKAEKIAEEKYQELQTYLYSGNIDSATIVSYDLLEYSKQNNLPKYEGIAHTRYGEVKLLEGENDSAIYYYKIADNIFESIGEELWHGKSNTTIGYIYNLNGEIDTAIVFYKKATEILNLNIDTTWYGVANSHLGNIYFRQGNYVLAGQYIQAALSAYILQENYLNIGMTYNTLALTYRHTKNKTKEKETYLSSIDAYLMIDECEELGMSYNNLAECYFNEGDTLLAFETLEKANTIYTNLGSIFGKTGYYSTLSYFYLNSEPPDYEKTIEYRLKSIEFAEECGDYRQYADGISFLGRAYLETNRFNEAKLVLEKGLEVAQTYQLTKEIIAITEALSIVYNELGLTQKAYDCLTLQVSLKDSIFNSEKMREFADLDAKFIYEQQRLSDSIQTLKNAQVQELKYQKDVQKKQRSTTLFIFIAIILFVFAFMIYLLSIKRKKNAQVLNEKNTIINKSLTEKELLLKEVHHRVKNNFQIISSLLDLQSKDIEDEKALATIHEGQNRVKAMSLIHQKLYQNEDLATINFSEYCEQLIKEIKSTFNIDAEISIKLEMPELYFDIDTAIPLGLILNELLTNSFKYAFTKSGSNSIIITIIQAESTYLLTFKDNGPGLPTDIDFNSSKTFGLRLTSRLSKQLLGSAKYSYENGSVFTIEFMDTIQRKDFD